MVLWVPIDRGLDNFPYYEAHGLAILALANRELAWPLGRIELAVAVVVLVSVAALLAVGTPLRPPSLGVAVPVGLAVAVLAWNVTAEIYAAIGEHDFSARVEANIPKPNDWIDRAAGDGSVVMLGQRMNDNPLGVPTTEFWNRSIEKVWSVDGTGPGPGDTLTPDLQDVDGTLYPDPETDYVLATNGVEVVGEQVAENAAANAALVPARRPDQASREQDRDRRGRLDASASRRPDRPRACCVQPLRRLRRRPRHRRRDALAQTFCPAGVRLRGLTRVRIGELGRGEDKQPAIARETDSETIYVPGCASRQVPLPTPDGPWRVEVETETFVPAEVDPASSERRALGAHVSFDVIPR